LSSQPVQQCGPSISNEFPIPDPNRTPGVVNPSVTLDVLQDPNFRISCYRNGATTAKEKNQTYAWYGIDHPANNTGRTQTCELDHLISLELVVPTRWITSGRSAGRTVLRC